MDEGAITEAAELLAGNRIRPGPYRGLPEVLRPRDEGAAYRIQDALSRRLEAAGWGEPAGYKIGCTSSVMQRFLGIDHPCAGRLHRNRIGQPERRFERERFHLPGVECEIAVRLAAPLLPAAQPHDAAAALRAVGTVCAAIEIVDARYLDYTTLGTATLIADDFFQSACVLGPEHPVAGRELGAIRGRMRIDGVTVGEGVGTDILGNPLQALVWLAGTLNQRGRALQAGDVVLLGSMVQTRWLARPSAPGRSATAVEVELDGLGLARAELG